MIKPDNKKSLQHSIESLDPGLLMLAVEQSPSSILITSPDREIIYVNQKYTESMGYSRKEVLGHVPQVFTAGNELIDSDAMWATLFAGRDWRGDIHSRRKSGELFWERVAISPIQDHLNKTTTHYLIIKEDITQQKEIAEELERSVAESTQMAAHLEYLNAELKSTQSQMFQREKMASIGQLAAGVAHEINNPIGFVSSNLRSLGKYLEKITDYVKQLECGLQQHSAEGWQEIEPLRKRLKIDYLFEDSKDLVAESLDGAERVRKIVQNLKTFSRVDQTGTQLVDLNECLESTVSIVWNEIKYKAQLTKKLGDLPPLECNSQELTQVFTNILVNAAQAIEKDGLIEIRSWCEADDIMISISDNGCGIRPADRVKIFEPFFTTKPVGQGTGLGMSISYEIIKKHGGDISFETEPGQGTVFHIRLPISTSDV